MGGDHRAPPPPLQLAVPLQAVRLRLPDGRDDADGATTARVPDQHLGRVSAGRGESTARDGHVVVQQEGLLRHGVADQAGTLSQRFVGVHFYLQLGVPQS